MANIIIINISSPSFLHQIFGGGRERERERERLSLYEPIPYLDGRSQELDWRFVGNKRLTMISTNVVYHTLINKHKWLEERVIKIWGFHKPITWWLHVIKAGWCS